MIGQIIASALGVLAFAILFHAPRRSYPFCALCGGLSWGMYLVFSSTGMGEFLASALTIFVMTIAARVLSVSLCMPATVFIVMDIFPLVPGAGIYYSAYALITSDMALFSEKGTETFVLAGAIALGIVSGMEIPQGVPNFFGGLIRRKFMKKKT